MTTGGGMIQTVHWDVSPTFAPGPAKFEAGTPNIAQVIGLGAAIDYLNELGMDTITSIKHELHNYARLKLGEIPSLTIYGDR